MPIITNHAKPSISKSADLLKHAGEARFLFFAVRSIRAIGNGIRDHFFQSQLLEKP
jgi:hypothetical protein